MFELSKSEKGYLPYDDILFTIFQGDDQALRALVRADVLRLDTQSSLKHAFNINQQKRIEQLKRQQSQMQLQQQQKQNQIQSNQSQFSQASKLVNDSTQSIGRFFGLSSSNDQSKQAETSTSLSSTSSSSNSTIVLSPSPDSSERILGRERIRAGSPVYLEAFKRMMIHDRLRPGLDSMVAKHYISSETKKLHEAEDELRQLSLIELQHTQVIAADKWGTIHSENEKVFDESKLIEQRRQFLLHLIQDSCAKIEKFDIQRREAEKAYKEKRPKHSTKQDEQKKSTPPQLQTR